MVELETVERLSSYGGSLFRQSLYNPAMDFWQRGTTRVPYRTDVFGRYGPDMWETFRAGWASGLTVTRQNGTGVLGCTYCARIQRDSGNTSTANCYFTQTLDIKDVPHLRGQYLTFSFWARKGANYSASGNYLYIQVMTGTGTNQPWSNGFTGGAFIADSNCVLTSDWQRFTFVSTAVVPSTTNEIGVALLTAHSGTAGANDYIEVTGLQLNTGRVALPFCPPVYETELQKCQRYFEKSYDIDTFAGASAYYGAYVLVEHSAHWFMNPQLQFKVRKAKIPSVWIYAAYTGNYGYFSEHNSGDTYTGQKPCSALNISESGFFFMNASGNNAGSGNFGRAQWMAICND